MILLYLSTPDRICVFLTYKHFFAYEDRKPLAQLLPSEKREMLCLRSKLERTPRIQLLRQLENERWRFCSQCWKLHPRSEWGLRSWISPLKINTRSCMSFSGEVYICPCLTITFPVKIRLMETINVAGQRDSSKRQYYYNKALYHPVSHRLEDRFSVLHECSILSHPVIELRIRTWLSVDQKTQELIVLSRFNCKFFEHSNTSLDIG